MTNKSDGSFPKRDRLFLIRGLQRGASVPLDEAGFRIVLGADDTADILLLREEVGETVLTLASTGDGRVEASVEGGTARIGKRVLKPGAPRMLRRLDPVGLGEARLAIGASLAEIDRAVRRRDRRARMLRWALPLPFAVAGGAIAFANVPLGGTGPNAARTPEPVMVPMGAETAAGPFSTRVAAYALLDRLADEELTAIGLKRHPDAAILIAEGIVRPSQAGTWLETQTWFDARYGSAIQLDNRVTVAAESITVPFSIESIWLSKTPKVTLHDGSDRLVGDTLPGGWLLEAIGPGGVEISRQGERLTLRL